MTEINLAYAPRDHFTSFHARREKLAAIVAHRRCGKTVACINDTIVHALRCKRKNPRYGYIAPTYRQAKEIAWQYLKDDARPVIKKIRESELSVELVNDAKVSLFGADNPDSLRGLYFDGVILDEFGDMKPNLWGEIIVPTLADRDGWVVFIGTPKGKNHFYDIVQRSQNEPGWYSLTLRVTDTDLFDADRQANFRAQMSDEEYRQEYLCDFTAAIMGAYYATLLENLQSGPAPDLSLPVSVSFDLGYTDSTAAWFWQSHPDGLNIIDYEEADNQALEYYFSLLRSKMYQYAELWLPHDAKAKSLQTGRSTVEQFLLEKFPVRIVPRLALQHGIDAARMILPMCRWDLKNPRVVQGIDALRSYRRSYDAMGKVYRDTPLHDWTSHPADAFRGLALVARRAIMPAPEVDTQTGKYGFTLEDLWNNQPSQTIRI